MTASQPVVSQEIVLSDEDLAIRAQLEESWKYPRGFVGWLRNTSHLSIGKRYIITAFVFFLLGGLEAGAMRAQLSRPENSWIGPDLYNQIFTMHGRR
jgi:Heme/copper-type cytochrome/quinol oxidases, subunit 1